MLKDELTPGQLKNPLTSSGIESEADSIGQIVANVPSGLSLTPLQEIKY
jgi:hypothetical protein